MRVRLTSQSEADIDEIAAYFLSHGASAERFLLGLFEAIEHLAHFPDTAVRRTDISHYDVRFWLVSPYWMVLKEVGDTLHVIAILHGSRKPEKVIRRRLREF